MIISHIKIKRLICVAGGGCLTIFTLLLLYHWGPVGIKAGDERVLANHQLATGDSLFVIAHRTTSWFEPYNIRLYRVNQETNYFVCFLSHEDAYWWGCSLSSSNPNGDIGIKAFGVKVATYTVSNHTVVWSDQKRPSSPSYSIDGIKVTIQIPKAIQYTKTNE